MSWLACAAAALAAGGAHAPSAEELAAWPDAFVPGKVAVIDRGGEPCYAFAGEAEDFFPGEGLETEAELHDEAVLDAKAHFYKAMADGDPTRVVSLLRAFVAYRWTDGAMHYVVCMVPVSAVSVSAAAAPAAVAANAAPVKAITEAGAGNVVPLQNQLQSQPQVNP